MASAGSAMRLAVLGAGKMGGILIEAFVKQGLVSPQNIHATVGHANGQRKNLAKASVSASTDNRAAARAADVIILGVKPQTLGQVVDEILPELDTSKLLISVAASVPTDYIERHIGGNVPVIRAMPNTPSMVGEGITAIARGKFATQAHVDTAQKLFGAVGKTVVVDEKHMDAVTGLSASGPAFIYIILESLAEGGVKVGLPRDLATLLAVADDPRRRENGDRDWRSSRAAERYRDHTCRLHHRRYSGTGRRWPARYADQSGGEGGAARQGIAAHRRVIRATQRMFTPQARVG